MDNLELGYKKVVASLQLLALPYSKQKTLFEDFVDAPFEVIDCYHNVFLQLPKIIERDILPNQTIADLIRLHNLINFTASNPEFKELEPHQFENANEWENIRTFAKQILDQMGEKVQEPQKQYI